MSRSMRLLSLLQWCALVAASPTPITFPLHARGPVAPRADSANAACAFHNSYEAALAKLGVTCRVPSPDCGDAPVYRRASSPVTGALNDELGVAQSDNLYYADVTIGTGKSKQTFPTVFDTGSADLVVPGPKCTACNGNTRYDQGGINQGNETHINYGSATISGQNYFDSVTILGLSAPHTNVVSLASSNILPDSSASAIFGLAFGGLTGLAESGQPTFFENLIAQKKVSNSSFAFHLGRHASNTKSQVSLGGVDSALYHGRVTTIPVTSQSKRWEIPIDNAIVSGSGSSSSTVDTSGSKAWIDTGANAILGPADAVAKVYAQIPGSSIDSQSRDGQQAVYNIPCDTNAVVSLGFGGVAFEINSLDFNTGPVDTGASSGEGKTPMCRGAIAAAVVSKNQMGTWLIGVPFLKNWVSVYSYGGSGGGPTVSFAAARGNQ